MKTLIGMALAVLSLAANAEDWILVNKSDKNGSLFADVSSFVVTKTEDNVQIIAAQFHYEARGVKSKEFALVTEVASCKNMKGDIYTRIFSDNEWITIDEYKWDKNGSKMFDAGGKFLCTLYNYLSRKKSKTEINV